MTMPPPQQPTGPYGPYGQPPQPQPYGQPYPHTAPQPHYGHPTAPSQAYPPYPGQATWGPPPPAPRRKSTAVLTLSVVFGTIAAGLGLYFLAYRGNDSSEPFPMATHRLTVPQTLLDGEYELIKDGSSEANTDMEKSGHGAGPDARNIKAVVGSYNGTSSTRQSGAVLTGMYGQFRNPEQPRDSLLDGMRKGDGMSEPKPARMLTPPGSDVEFRCTVMLSKDTDGTSTVPVCAWGDDNTAAYVAFLTPASDAQDPDSVDLEDIAQKTLKIREEVRQPID